MGYFVNGQYDPYATREEYLRSPDYAAEMEEQERRQKEVYRQARLASQPRNLSSFSKEERCFYDAAIGAGLSKWTAKRLVTAGYSNIEEVSALSRDDMAKLGLKALNEMMLAFGRAAPRQKWVRPDISAPRRPSFLDDHMGVMS